jgi:hypothetical protein
MAVEEHARSEAPGAGTFISLAFKATSAAVRSMPVLFGCAVFLCVLVKLVDIGIENSADFLGSHLGRVGATVLSWLWAAISFLLDAWVLAPVAVAVHRMVLLREATLGFIAWNHPRIWRFLGWTLLLELATDIVALPFFVIPEGPKLFASLVVGILVMIVSMRTLMIFPAVAVETPVTNWRDRIGTSWDATRGHFWRLTLALLGAFLMLYVPLLAVGGVVSFFVVFLGDIQAYSVFGIVTDLVLAALNPINIALGAAVASWFYMWLHQDHDHVLTEVTD